MENKINLNSPKTGLLKLGYVTNLKSCKAELNELLTDEKQVSTAELNALVDRASIVYLNKYGYAQSRSGEWRKRSIPTHSNGSIHSLLSPKIGLRSA